MRSGTQRSASTAISRADNQLTGRVGATFDFGKMRNFPERTWHVRARPKSGGGEGY